MDEWTHRYISSRACPTAGYGSRAIISVEAGLHQLGGNPRPYFSVTGDISIPSRNDCECCGCIHEEIVKYWPKLAPIITLHLCDDNGQPMHAEANGWYQLAGYYCLSSQGFSAEFLMSGQRYHAGNSKGHHGGEYRPPTADECLTQWADHVRIPIEQARELAEGWRCDDDPKASRRWFTQWLNTQAERFKTEADVAVALLDSLIEQRNTQLAARAEKG